MSGKTFRVVKLTWIDPTSIDEWGSREDAIAYVPHKIITCGILIGETETCWIVSANMDLVNDDVSCVMIVPKAALIEPLEVISDEREKIS